MERTRFSRTFRSGNLQSKKALGRLCIEDVKEWRIFGELERDRIIVATAEKGEATKVEKYGRWHLCHWQTKYVQRCWQTGSTKKRKKRELYENGRGGASGFRWYLCLNLNYLVERELKRSRKVVATLVDFKVAVNLVDMTILRRSLE